MRRPAFLGRRRLVGELHGRQSDQDSAYHAFRGRAATMIVGSFLTQGVTFLSVVLFARLYSQEAIGLSYLCVSIAGVMTVFATLRLDLAIVLAGNARDSARILVTIFLQTTLLAGLLLALTTGLGTAFAERVAPGIATDIWVWLIAPLVVVTVLVQVGLAEANRDGRFSFMVFIEFGISATTILAGLALFLLHPSNESLVLARLASQSLGVIGLLCVGYLAVGHKAFGEMRSAATRTWLKYRQFVIFNTPYSIIGTFTRDLPIYVFSIGGGAPLVAQYAMARAITMAPTTLFSTAISRVYYKEAVNHLGTPYLESLTTGLSKFTMFVSLAPFALLSVWGDVGFGLVLGEKWKLAGIMAMLLAPSLWMSLQTAWTQRIFEATQRQGIAFALQVSFDIVHAATVITVYAATGSPIWTIAAYGLTYLIFVTCYLVAVFRVARFALATLIPLLVGAFLSYAGCMFVFAGIRVASGSSILGMVFCTCLALILAATGGVRLRRTVTQAS